MTDLLGIVSLATRGLAYTDTQELLMPVHATVPWHVFTLVLLIQRTTLFMLLLLVGALTDSRYCCLISTVLNQQVTCWLMIFTWYGSWIVVKVYSGTIPLQIL